MKVMNFKKYCIGLLSGLVSGLFSSGGALLIIPLYRNLFHSDEKEARATAVFCVLPMVIITALFYGFKSYMNWRIGILCAIGGIFGGLLGSYFLKKLNPKYLKIFFIVFLIYSGIRILIK